MNKLISFYLNESPDSEDRMWEDIMKFKHAELEYVHDYIQWLFPLEEPSNFNSDAPLLTIKERTQFHTNPILKDHLLQAFRKILDFYGFKLKVSGMDTEEIYDGTYIGRNLPIIEVVRSENWDSNHKWITKYNHNYLRITRILKCMKLCGLRSYGLAFYTALKEVFEEYGNTIGQRTWIFWEEAAF